MKPNPRLFLDAMTAIGVTPAECVFIGDAVRDVEAGHAAGIPTIGYANKPGKAERLAEAEAITVVDTMSAIVDALRGHDI
ncbi:MULTISPECIES: HAD family hydrolase [unclassified Streptomyces]|uniref:HAD family hydrolase n=1 Tax=unclassified Streptomyces TaxID=2593676 RepID=UPI002E2BF283|nr:HAD-IA family hydrolase [Streptomyces sp. NBC_00223]